ncbi:MAG TPA: hypothetical protein RMH85_29300 [Polyangiaceae bacterium LLY-WYZ-15_(1-7)]|nr:hypothetical protein [Myxococcales bacterium]MAT27119.1 hypothetical protein [Sandaracinus sp.]HJK93727.1 hypothetical protein [Polyangiaceae bacterium LLY-WYZ-15_(1-7)]HJL06805.1 hypothetical protein [Polyangiaceae bacterium LLY-WYZ-15_(1-7)]HJL12613.1 hypothetical protein [Polyangiaceae bacterium LLY-WYZ-15_(1-7)]
MNARRARNGTTESGTPKRRPTGRLRAPSLRDDEAGLSTVEYIIILVLIAITAIVVWKQFGESVEYHVRDSTTQINGLGD